METIFCINYEDIFLILPKMYPSIVVSVGVCECVCVCVCVCGCECV